MFSVPDNYLQSEDIDDDDLIDLPPEVLAAIEQVLPSNDPLDRHDFDVVDYINQLFPNEQSLGNIDDVISSMTERVRSIDQEIRNVVRGHTNAGQDGKRALEEAQKSIMQLFNKISEIKGRAELSEQTVKEITRDIKQLDQGKRNLTATVTTLNHLHMLAGGVDTLQSQICQRQYSDIAMLLEGVMKVLEHFDKYLDIPQIKELADQVHKIRADLAEQISADFREAFSATNTKKAIPSQQLGEACLVVNVLEPKVKRDLLKWFVGLQLAEYTHLFGANEEQAWLDSIDKRYTWLKRRLIEFEERFGRLFPPEWEVSERIAVEFCHVTRVELSAIMARRVSEMDVKLLLFAIQRTSGFETLLSRRFSGVTLQQERRPATAVPPPPESTNPFGEPEPESTNPFEQEEAAAAAAAAAAVLPRPEQPVPSDPFQGIISQCFEQHLNIYIESQDRNLSDLLERFSQELKSKGFPSPASESSLILPSCADLFMFYKKCMLQCSQLSRGRQLLALTAVFQKHLREYALKILLANLPKQTVSAAGGSSGKTLPLDLKDLSNLSNLRDMATAGFLHNFQSLLKEGEIQRLTRDDLGRVCSVLTTAEYCLETTQQLESKLKERVEPALVDKINLSSEQDVFHNVIGNCVQVLVQDLETACDPALVMMTKMSWQNVESVGDQSGYVSTITSQLKQTVPVVRDNLAGSRKYFTQFCVKFANSFIPKFIQHIYKCKPVSTVGAEQLLLDTHSLKTELLDLPSLGSQVQRSAPASYTKIVVKGMTRAEMLLKVVMSPHERPADYVEQYSRLLPESDAAEFQKVLDMKGVRRTEQSQLQEAFRSSRPGGLAAGGVPSGSPEHEAGRIHRLEKLIKRRM
ncbi:vacuolar protein sorting-associated protein 53 homolog [Pollicipes pollicipes]|uniref:vacuolar protein sorting-associated protein 53 homolog n=1 Tax=Pollicipes pollicipes TaxID=41117 RepID=UPI001885066C|nr:vacuolar protein sorting-associated protein 53 homolog [Pollicipes pollicipes]